MLKALQGISYTEIAGYLEIHRNSLYNWLKGHYDLSAEKEKRLIEIINLLTE
jgi:predicted transcriptional regulator